MNQEKMLLSAKGLCKSFGGIQAVNNACLEVRKGSITGLIGPNGAGKTTLFNLLSNFIWPDRGEVSLDGHSIHHLPSYQIARQGCVRTFQVARVLSRLTVLDNMLLATPHQTGENFLQLWFQQPQIRKQERENKEKALNILESVGLAAKARDCRCFIGRTA
jgi:neutral amino acid transport system ATP-binding protein